MRCGSGEKCCRFHGQREEEKLEEPVSLERSKPEDHHEIFWTSGLKEEGNLEKDILFNNVSGSTVRGRSPTTVQEINIPDRSFFLSHEKVIRTPSYLIKIRL